MGCIGLILIGTVFSFWQNGWSFQQLGSGKAAAAGTAKKAPVKAVSRRPLGGDIEPETTVWDPYPTFNGITVDTENNRVVMTDLNRHSILSYDRLATTKTGEPTPSLQHIIGPATEMGFVAGVAVDPEKREIYAAENDAWGIRIFSYDDQGNAVPRRILAAPHQTWGISLSRQRHELAATVEELDSVVVYRQSAEKLEPPLRTIRGEQTGLADPHGIYLDGINNEMFVTNHGSWTKYMPNTSHDPLPPVIPRTAGHTDLPSITVYSAMATGDAKPVRLIQGKRTGLDWPMQIDADPSHNELAVANFGANSVVIFRRTDQGDAVPLRVIRGEHTGISGPIGVNIDAKNDEIWVANYGDHTALAFARTAEGDAKPKRIIRNAPEKSPTCGFTDASAAAYDSKRKEVLVAN